MSETVTVLTPGTITNPYSGEDTPSWTVPPSSSVDVPGVAVEPRPSGEPVQDARNAVVSGFTLYLPSEAVVTAHSRVVVRGGTYDVIGEPAVWQSPFSDWAAGTVVQVQRVEG
jgi:hypothetical protein